MLIKIAPISLLIFFCSIVYGQQSTKKYFVKKSTITSIGSTNYLVSNTVKVLHSSGQSSIIGLKKINKYTVQQGFINSQLLFEIDNSDNFIREELKFVISPNPFVDHVTVKFAVKPNNDVHIKVYDINGKLHLAKTYQPNINLHVPLSRFSIGTYLIKVESGMNSTTEKIIKH